MDLGAFGWQGAVIAAILHGSAPATYLPTRLPAHLSACLTARLLTSLPLRSSGRSPSHYIHSCSPTSYLSTRFSTRCTPRSAADVRRTLRPAVSSSALWVGGAAGCSTATTGTEGPTSSRDALTKRTRALDS